MGIDPTQGFPITPAGRVADRLSDYERRLSALERGGPDLAPVDTLPAQPRLGQLVCYQTAAMASLGVRWELKYNASSGSAYKWEFVGGGDWSNQNNTSGTVASTTAVAFSNTPTITVPLAGDYFVHATGDWNTADSTKQGIVAGGNGVVFTPAHRMGWSANSVNVIFGASGVLTFSASNDVKLYGYTTGGTATLTANSKVLTVRPVRVG